MRISSSDYAIEHCFFTRLDEVRHYHDSLRINYILKGKLKYTVEGEETIVEKGDLCLVNNNVFHEAILLEDTEMLSLIINHRFLSWMLNHKHFGFAIRKNPYRTPELILILLEVYSYHKKDRMLETYLLLLKMIKILKEETGIVSTDSFSSNVLLFVQQYIDRHYQNHINLEALSELTHYNESYLSTQFKKTFGIGINEYLRNVRMEHALLDLMESDKKILEIAFQNGFESIQSFNRIFKKLYDETPKNYRERSREMVCPS